MKKAFKSLVASATLSLVLMAQKAAAQVGGGGLGSQDDQLNLIGVAGKNSGLASVIGGIVNFFLGFVGLVAVLILIYGGFTMITSAGDADKFAEGRKMIIYAIIGIVIIVVSWTVVGTLLEGLTSVG